VRRGNKAVVPEVWQAVPMPGVSTVSCRTGPYCALRSGWGRGFLPVGVCVWGQRCMATGHNLFALGSGPVRLRFLVDIVCSAVVEAL